MKKIYYKSKNNKYPGTSINEIKNEEFENGFDFEIANGARYSIRVNKKEICLYDEEGEIIGNGENKGKKDYKELFKNLLDKCGIKLREITKDDFEQCDLCFGDDDDDDEYEDDEIENNDEGGPKIGNEIDGVGTIIEIIGDFVIVEQGDEYRVINKLLKFKDGEYLNRLGGFIWNEGSIKLNDMGWECKINDSKTQYDKEGEEELFGGEIIDRIGDFIIIENKTDNYGLINKLLKFKDGKYLDRLGGYVWNRGSIKLNEIGWECELNNSQRQFDKEGEEELFEGRLAEKIGDFVIIEKETNNFGFINKLLKFKDGKYLDRLGGFVWTEGSIHLNDIGWECYSKGIATQYDKEGEEELFDGVIVDRIGDFIITENEDKGKGYTNKLFKFKDGKCSVRLGGYKWTEGSIKLNDHGWECKINGVTSQYDKEGEYELFEGNVIKKIGDFIIVEAESRKFGTGEKLCKIVKGESYERLDGRVWPKGNIKQNERGWECIAERELFQYDFEGTRLLEEKYLDSQQFTDKQHENGNLDHLMENLFESKNLELKEAIKMSDGNFYSKILEENNCYEFDHFYEEILDDESTALKELKEAHEKQRFAIGGIDAIKSKMLNIPDSLTEDINKEEEIIKNLEAEKEEKLKSIREKFDHISSTLKYLPKGSGGEIRNILKDVKKEFLLNKKKIEKEQDFDKFKDRLTNLKDKENGYIIENGKILNKEFSFFNGETVNSIEKGIKDNNEAFKRDFLTVPDGFFEEKAKLLISDEYTRLTLNLLDDIQFRFMDPKFKNFKLTKIFNGKELEFFKKYEGEEGFNFMIEDGYEETKYDDGNKEIKFLSGNKIDIKIWDDREKGRLGELKSSVNGEIKKFKFQDIDKYLNRAIEELQKVETKEFLKGINKTTFISNIKKEAKEILKGDSKFKDQLTRSLREDYEKKVSFLK